MTVRREIRIPEANGDAAHVAMGYAIVLQIEVAAER